MSTPAPKKRRGRKADPVGFTNILLAVFWPAYVDALNDWQAETKRILGEHFTTYAKARALEILRVASNPASIATASKFHTSFAAEPDFVSFVLRRFIRLRETGDAKGKAGTVCARGLLKIIIAANPALAPEDVAELARKSDYGHHAKIRTAIGNDVSKAREKLRRANLERLAKIQAENDAEAKRREQAEASLSVADKRKLATYRRQIEALAGEHLPAAALTFQAKARKLTEQNKALLDRII